MNNNGGAYATPHWAPLRLVLVGGMGSIGDNLYRLHQPAAALAALPGVEVFEVHPQPLSSPTPSLKTMHPFPSCLQATPLSVRALLGSTALLSAIATSAPAAHAIGFLNLNSGSWTGALECPIPGESFDCVENITASTVTLVGPEAGDSFISYTSQPVPVGDPGYTISFDYVFDAFQFQEAFYMVGGQSFTLEPTEGFITSIDSISLLPGQSFSFMAGNTETV